MLKNKSTFLIYYLLFTLLLPLSAGSEEISEPSGKNEALFKVSNTEIISLEGTWKVKLKDSMMFAGSVYGDSNWRLTTVPGNLVDINPGYRGIAWYRARLRFSHGASKNSFIMMLGKISVADEVYFNGVMIGQTGSVSDSTKQAFDRIRYYTIPGYLIDEEGDNTIAVRVRGYLSDSFGMVWGEYKAGPAELLHKEISISYISEIFFISLYLFVGFFFLIFSRLPTFLSRQQFYFALVSFVTGGYLFCIGQVKYLLTDAFFPFHLTQYILALGGIVVLTLLIRFLYSQTVSVMDKVLFFLISLGVINVLLFMDIRLWVVPLKIMQSAVLYIAVLIIKNIIQSIMNGSKELTYVNIALGVFLFSAIFEILRAYSIVPDFDYLKVGLPAMVFFLSYFMAQQYSMVRQIEKRAIENLEMKVQERTRELRERNDSIEGELEIARMIQSKLLPSQSPDFEGLKVFAECISMDKVGGDFYDYYETEKGVRFLIADVSGHGVASAFLALITRNALSYPMRQNEPDEAVLHRLNSVVFKHAVLSHFVTAAVCTIDLGAMEISISNAGHFPLLLCRKGEKCRELYVKGRPLGWNEEVRISSMRTKIEKGDRIIMFTDGIIESIDQNNNLFGIERLKDLAKDTRGISSDDAAREIIRQAVHFSGEEKPDDDMSIVIIDIDPGPREE